MLLISSNRSAKHGKKRKLPWGWILLLLFFMPLALTTVIISVED
jgi:hypothetical protein